MAPPNPWVLQKYQLNNLLIEFMSSWNWQKKTKHCNHYNFSKSFHTKWCLPQLFGDCLYNIHLCIVFLCLVAMKSTKAHDTIEDQTTLTQYIYYWWVCGQIFFSLKRQTSRYKAELTLSSNCWYTVTVITAILNCNNSCFKLKMTF